MNAPAPTPIQHVFVLMLENRSFDHLFAFAGIPNVSGQAQGMTNPNGQAPPIAADSSAPDTLAKDPNHEFKDVDLQLYGPSAGPIGTNRPVTMQGFVASNGIDAMRCCSPISTPALSFLAEKFLVCDHWFSSMPGPTWPNRFFVHAGSSGGLEGSPSSLTTIASMTDPELGFSFDGGTIFDRLGAGNWRVYHGDHFPQVCAIGDMPSVFVAGPDKFRPLSQLAADLQQGDAVSYTFIEPDYSVLSKFKDGNSHHPCGSLMRGDSLVMEVYDAIRQLPLWQSSMLIILYDEHGGLYDSAAPGTAAPPGDSAVNASKSPGPTGFAFDRYGVRVPAIVVSPWVTPGTVSHTTYDHTSIIRTVFELNGLKGNLTDRDSAAASLVSLLQPTIQTPVASAVPIVKTAEASLAPVAAATAAPPSLAGFTRIAARVHHALLSSQATQQPGAVHAQVFAQAELRSLPGLPLSGNDEDTLAYISQVADLMRTHRTMQGAAPIK